MQARTRLEAILTISMLPGGSPSDVAKDEDNSRSKMGWGVREGFGCSLLLQQSQAAQLVQAPSSLNLCMMPHTMA